MIEANRWKLGLFIIIGVVLLLGGIIYFGVSQFFVPTINVVTVFDESVDGLSVGSPVKYNGVPMGSVSKILINYGGNITVFMELYPDALDLKDRGKVLKDIHDREYVQNLVNSFVNKGFRCSLQLSGISGNKYIGIMQYNTMDEDFLEIKPRNKDILKNNIFFPAVPSFISGAADNVSKLLNQIAKINFKNIEENVNTNLSALNTLTKRLNILLDTVESEGMERMLLQSTAKLDETLDSLTELCNQISRQPNSILRGNETETIFPPASQ